MGSAESPDVCRDFDSLAQQAEWARRGADRKNGSSDGDGFAFDEVRTHTLDEALALAITGDAALSLRVQALADRIVAKLAPSIVSDDVTYVDSPGVGFDVSLVCAGVPECWLDLTSERYSDRGPVWLRASIGVSGRIGADLLERRGSYIAAVVALLQRQGRPVRLDVDYLGRGREGKFYRSAVRLCDYGQPVNTDVLAYVLAHPSYLRRVVFAVLEGESSEVRGWIGAHRHAGYGTPTSTAMHTFPCVVSSDDKSVDPWRDDESAEREITRLLAVV